MPKLPPEPTDIEPPPKPSDKLDLMSKNCDELKRTLAQLQGQMNAMAIDKQQPDTASAATAAAPAPSNKKAKNKKSKTKSESKAAAAKVAKETSPTNGGAVADKEPAAPINDSVAELVNKVLAENPPPIEFLEKVLGAEVFAEMLNDVADDSVNNAHHLPDNAVSSAVVPEAIAKVSEKAQLVDPIGNEPLIPDTSADQNGHEASAVLTPAAATESNVSNEPDAAAC